MKHISEALDGVLMGLGIDAKPVGAGRARDKIEGRGHLLEPRKLTEGGRGRLTVRSLSFRHGVEGSEIFPDLSHHDGSPKPIALVDRVDALGQVSSAQVSAPVGIVERLVGQPKIGEPIVSAIAVDVVDERGEDPIGKEPRKTMGLDAPPADEDGYVTFFKGAGGVAASDLVPAVNLPEKQPGIRLVAKKAINHGKGKRESGARWHLQTPQLAAARKNSAAVTLVWVNPAAIRDAPSQEGKPGASRMIVVK